MAAGFQVITFLPTSFFQPPPFERQAYLHIAIIYAQTLHTQINPQKITGILVTTNHGSKTFHPFFMFTDIRIGIIPYIARQYTTQLGLDGFVNSL
ncbi:MAG: hypothetical protein UZ08_BCD001002149 [Candidatus Parvibacillus calidus]|nr:MAG: hypothetical protein UZ08_BCD001002149 [Candidatus Parvibacillus calidus]